MPTKILLYGILVVAIVLALTVAIIAAAPYIAILIVLASLGWFFLSKEKDEPPDDPSS